MISANVKLYISRHFYYTFFKVVAEAIQNSAKIRIHQSISDENNISGQKKRFQRPVGMVSFPVFIHFPAL